MEDVKKVTEYFREEVREHAGTNLVSLVLYGSAVTPDFVQGKSDFNFMIVADPLDMALLDRLAGRAKDWRKKRIPVPLLFSPAFIAGARDSYPLEFLAMQAAYELVDGTDVLADVQIDRKDARLQCESELRGKLLLFRRAYVESGGDARYLQELIVHGVPALGAIFRGLLYLREVPWNRFGADFRKDCAEHLGIPIELMDHLYEIRRQKKKPRPEEVRADLDGLLGVLQRLADDVDRW